MSKNSISSGAEQALHSGQLAVKHSLILALVFVIFGGVSLGGATYLITSPAQRYAFQYQIGIAEIGGIVNNREKAAMDRQIAPDLDAFWQAVKKSLPMGAMGGAAAVWALLWMFKNLGDSTKQKTRRRGSRLASAEELAREIRKRARKDKTKPDLQLCGVPLPPGVERTHILLAGTTGVGKSTAMRELLDQVREKNEQAICFDPGGHFMSEYGREGDVLLNPFDRRADRWSLFHEIETERDCIRIAASLVPKKEGKDEGFANGARAIVSSLLWRLAQQTEPSMEKFYDWLVVADHESLAEFLKGTPGARPLGDGAAEQASGMLSFASESAQAIKAFAEIERADRQKNDPRFSIRSWVQKGAPGSICWLTSQKSHHQEIQPLISLWLDLAAAELMASGETKQRRLWFLIDELPSLNKLESLPVVLAEGRKYGAAAVLGLQNMAQLREKYGKDGATALLDLLNTRLVFRCSDPEMADYASKSLGEIENESHQAGESMGRREGLSLSQKIEREPLVMPSQILNLQKYHAYMMLPDDLPHSVVKTQERKEAVQKLHPFREWMESC